MNEEAIARLLVMLDDCGKFGVFDHTEPERTYLDGELDVEQLVERLKQEGWRG